MASNSRSGELVIVSGPSGAGKSTVVRRFIERCPLPLILSVSATTRPPREGERDGSEYHFLSQRRFTELREADEFLECKEVFGRGDWYGTLRQQVSTGLSSGKWVVLEIDVEGMQSVVEQVPGAITFFLHPGSLKELEQRLRNRNTESEESIQRRLEVARKELSVKSRFKHEIINDEVDRAAKQMCDTLMHIADEARRRC